LMEPGTPTCGSGNYLYLWEGMDLINRMMQKWYRADVGKVLEMRLRLYKMQCIAILLSIMLLLMPVLGSCSSSPNPVTFSPLCHENFPSANTPAKVAIVPTPATSLSDDGEPIGLSEGANVFDLHRSDFQDKHQAAQDWRNNPQGVVSSLQNALKRDPTDAEAQIYLENWKVLRSNHPYLTFVVGVSFSSSSAKGSSRDVLQGAFTAQKECNDQKQQDGKTKIVLMIGNIGGNTLDDRASNAKFVANQIADQTVQNKTLVAIMGWATSADSINVNHQLKIRGSHLPMISPSSSSDELGGMSNFFRVCPTNSEQAQVVADFLLRTKQKKKIAILYDQTTSYSNNLKNDFTQNVANHIVGSESYVGGDSRTLQDALGKVLARKPDAIFFSGYPMDLVVLLKDISSTPSAHLLIVGGDALATTNSYPNSLPDLHNVYFSAFASPNEWDGMTPQPSFFQEYQTNFGTLKGPTGFPIIDATVMLGYDALLTLLHGSQQVLSTKSTITASDLTQALKQITGSNAIQGNTGRIAFDPNGNQDQRKIIFVEHIEGTNLVIDEKQGCLYGNNCSS
jgi:eukaryotic-like serine/threonine-protein kinase